MESAVERYKRLVAEALARYFPRTTEYLRAEREAAQPNAGARGKAKGKAKAAGKAPAKRGAKARKDGDAPAPKRPRTPTVAGIYGTASAADEQCALDMRQRVAQAAAHGIVSLPSDEQWAMILAPEPLTRIFAGAGSGKSTTLVLRVVYMLCHLGVDAEKVTVISFTNASCAQLREQLVKVLGYWGHPFDAAQARQCVRTFHSAMGTLAKVALKNPRWFEQLDERDPASELDNPLLAGRLRPAQQRLLKQVYQQCYAEQPAFRTLVHQLLELPPPPEAGEDGKPPRIGKAPLDAFKLPGEFTALPLFEAFYAQSGFIESIGLRIDQLQPQKLACPPRERQFVEALQLFWAAFDAALQEQGLLTFNLAFQRLTDLLGDGKLPAEALAPFQHLLIDEFQDVSPQIVQWLQALHRDLAKRGEAVSLMAIGDDWQSIYAWRGSSPELFMDFDRHFPSKGRRKSRVLLLETNYRSIDPVIRDGERVLVGVANKQAKTCRAFKTAEAGGHGVKLVQRFDARNSLPLLLEEIRKQCEHVAARGSREKTAVLLLSRRNETLQTILGELDRKLPVKGMTIHRAKGLQAEVAIIVDDCAPPEKHPLRGALYVACGFFASSYEQAQQDEQLCLAYVAITRGVSRVFWFTRKAQGPTAILALRRNVETAPA
ncbi:DEAD/DEAH box helicase [Pseudomonas denitrificans (nom. rej.)]|uniref:AAA family ATPase n=1 Tax=Pseudomonas denitrificans TaxID=43306 RepID=A0A9X7R3P9_PSEDE|nr:DEAD/DEAH box helicase [Pseudomonas denitrificans (nom. rej.)]QEY71632.1 AAA family ATPase [Pseudomonas denitrificans (nom. rej.)]